MIDSKIPFLIEEVIKLTLEGQFGLSENILKQLDSEALHRERLEVRNQIKNLRIKNVRSVRVERIGVKESDKKNTFIRDNYRCRYKHCQRLTIDLSVLRELSRIYPLTFSYHKNWKFGYSHILYWLYATSLEHKISFPDKGNSEPSNLITACYLCNDSKNKYALEKLGWEVTNPSTEMWDGLTRYVRQLKMVNYDSNNYFPITVKAEELKPETIKRLDNSLNFKTNTKRINTKINNYASENIVVSSDALAVNKVLIGSILQAKTSKNVVLFGAIKDNQALIATKGLAWFNDRVGSTAINYKVIYKGSGKLPESFSNVDYQKCLMKVKEYAVKKNVILVFE